MRLKTPTFIRLERSVSRRERECHWCGYQIVYLDPVFVPHVGGSSLELEFCRERCASAVVRVPMVVSYLAAA